MKSCGSKGASLYLMGPLSYDDEPEHLRMDSATFVTALRLRLGQHVLADAPGSCPFCRGEHATDADGTRSITCMKGG